MTDEEIPIEDAHIDALATLNDTNATMIYTDDCPWNTRKKYRYWHGYNSGLYNFKWANKTRLRSLDNEYMCEGITSQLDMTQLQKVRAKNILRATNLKRVGHRADKVIFCICAYVCRYDGRDYHPRRSPERNDSEFVWFAETLGYDSDEIHAIMNQILDKKVVPNWILT